jgi:hypothetical protein
MTRTERLQKANTHWSYPAKDLGAGSRKISKSAGQIPMRGLTSPTRPRKASPWGSEEESASLHVSVERLKELLRKQEQLLEDERFHIMQCPQCGDLVVQAILKELNQ